MSTPNSISLLRQATSALIAEGQSDEARRVGEIVSRLSGVRSFSDAPPSAADNPLIRLMTAKGGLLDRVNPEMARSYREGTAATKRRS